jgi:hypothetical protein
MVVSPNSDVTMVTDPDVVICESCIRSEITYSFAQSSSSFHFLPSSRHSLA